MSRRAVLGILGGAVIGFAVGALVYSFVNPMLEDASGWLRETQGLLWNLVPFLTVLSALAGGLLMRGPDGRRS